MGGDDGDSAPSERGEISSGERGLLSALFPLLYLSLTRGQSATRASLEQLSDVAAD